MQTKQEQNTQPLSSTRQDGKPTGQRRDDAEQFIEALAGSAEAQVTFQVLPDDRSNTALRPQILHGSLEEHWDVLVDLNQAGMGIFLMVNGGDLKGRGAENVTHLRALFIDDDQDTNPDTAALPPSIQVQSKRGLHQYWLLQDGEALGAFTGAQAALARRFGTDGAVKDLPRVMRLPGFFHMKDPASPFLVTLLGAETTRHTIAQVLGAYPTTPAKPAGRMSRGDGQGTRSSVEVLRRARAYVAKVPPAVQGKQGDQATFGLCATLTRGFDLADDEVLDLLSDWNGKCQPPWSEEELMLKINNARQYGEEQVGGRLARGSGEYTVADLAYMIPMEKYVIRRADRQWDLAQPIGREAAAKHLHALGVQDEDRVLAENLHPIAHGHECCPDAAPVFERDGRTFLNSYVPPKLVPKPGPWPRISRIVATLTGGDADSVRWLLNWSARLVQHPAARSMTAVVFQGGQGIGKTLYGGILAEIIGPENTASIDQDGVNSQYNAPYATKLLVRADEVMTRENAREVSNKLKKSIADPTVMVHGKYKGQYEAQNRMSWIFTSNESTPVRVEGDDDRRYTVFCCPTPAPAEHKAMLRGLFQPTGEFTPSFQEEVAAFAQHLLDLEVDHELAVQVHHTEARQRLIEAGRSSVEAFCQELSDRGVVQIVTEYHGHDDPKDPVSERWNFGTEGVTAKAVYSAYRKFCEDHGYSGIVNEGNFGKELRLRFHHVERERLGKSPRPWVYCGMPAGLESDIVRKFAGGEIGAWRRRPSASA